MSAQPELFEALFVAGRRFVTKVAHSTGKPADRVALAARLREVAKAYVAQGGASEVTETMVSELVARVTTWCTEEFKVPTRKGRNSPSNEALFRFVQPKANVWAKEWLRVRKGRGSIDREALRSFLQGEVTAYRSVPGQAHEDDCHEALVDRIVAYSGRMSRDAGRQVRAEIREANAKPGATKRARQEVEFAVWSVLDKENYWAEQDRREPRQFTLDEIHEAVAFETILGPDGSNLRRSTGITRSAVRGVVERIKGRPRRQRRVDALPNNPRDLVAVLDAETAEKRVTVLVTDTLASRLWAPAGNAAARRQQRLRLRRAVDEINAIGISLHVEVHGDETVVANGVRMPEDVAGVIESARAANEVRRLQVGLYGRRQGLLGSTEGRDCVAMCRAASNEYGKEDVNLVLDGYGLPDASTTVKNLAFTMGERFLDGIHVVAGELRALAHEDDPEYDQHAAAAHVLVRSHQDCNDRQSGPCQAWYAMIGSRAYRARIAGADNSASRHRVRRIGALLGDVRDMDMASLDEAFSAAAVRPGRKPKAVVPPPRPIEVQRPVKEPAVSKPRPATSTGTFTPTYVPPSRLSMETLEALEIHHTLNTIRPAATTVLAMYLDITVGDVHAVWPDFTNLPWHDQPEAAKAGLRRVLRAWEDARFEKLRLLDVDARGAAKEALLASGCALRDDPGAPAVAFANDVVSAIYGACQGVERGRNLRPQVLLAAERYEWLKARAGATATTRAA